MDSHTDAPFATEGIPLKPLTPIIMSILSGENALSY